MQQFYKRDLTRFMVGSALVANKARGWFSDEPIWLGQEVEAAHLYQFVTARMNQAKLELYLLDIDKPKNCCDRVLIWNQI